jgi:hypothetical protein
LIQHKEGEKSNFSLLPSKAKLFLIDGFPFPTSSPEPSSLPTIASNTQQLHPCRPGQRLSNSFVNRASLSPQNELAEHLSLIVQRKTLDSPKAGILMARLNPLRSKAIDVVFSPLDRPDHLGLLHASGFKAYILCHFLDLVKIHRIPPKSWVCGNSTPDLTPSKISLKEFVSRAGSLQSKCFPRLSSYYHIA